MRQPKAGTAVASTVVTATGDGGSLYEYGVFYSTDRSLVETVSGGTTDTARVGMFNIQPGLKKVVVPLIVRSVAPTESGTLNVTLGGLQQNVTYHYRFFTVGHAGPAEILTALKVGSFKSVSNNAYLGSLKVSAGTLSNPFRRWRYFYRNTLPASKSKCTVSVTRAMTGQVVKVKVGSGAWSTATSKTVSVARGSSKTVYFRVTATDKKTTKTYTVVVARK